MEKEILTLWQMLNDSEKKEVIKKIHIYYAKKGKQNKIEKSYNKRQKIVSSQLSTATTH